MDTLDLNRTFEREDVRRLPNSYWMRVARIAFFPSQLKVKSYPSVLD